jgi:hypothetical protein
MIIDSAEFNDRARYVCSLDYRGFYIIHCLNVFLKILQSNDIFENVQRCSHFWRQKDDVIHILDENPKIWWFNVRMCIVNLYAGSNFEIWAIK